jgi:hypothetical protein
MHGVAYSPRRPEWAYNPDLTFQERIQSLREFEGRDGPPDRLDNEDFWAAVLPQLISYGYMLRPRYRPGWKPSYNSVLATMEAKIEDAIVASVRALCLIALFCVTSLTVLFSFQADAFMDAERVEDHVTVALKRTTPSDPEAEIACLLSSQALRSDSRNHCVPILDVFTVTHTSNIFHQEFNWTILVMPLLRKFDDPPFETVGDCVSFGQQMLEVC